MRAAPSHNAGAVAHQAMRMELWRTRPCRCCGASSHGCPERAVLLVWARQGSLEWYRYVDSVYTFMLRDVKLTGGALTDGTPKSAETRELSMLKVVAVESKTVAEGFAALLEMGGADGSSAAFAGSSRLAQFDSAAELQPPQIALRLAAEGSTRATPIAPLTTQSRGALAASSSAANRPRGGAASAAHQGDADADADSDGDLKDAPSGVEGGGAEGDSEGDIEAMLGDADDEFEDAPEGGAQQPVGGGSAGGAGAAAPGGGPAGGGDDDDFDDDDFEDEEELDGGAIQGTLVAGAAATAPAAAGAAGATSSAAGRKRPREDEDEDAIDDAEGAFDDEDELNSDDDDDEEEDGGPSGSGAAGSSVAGTNLLIAQFDRVKRVRNQWKVTFKAGMGVIDSKGYAFACCEAEFLY